MWKKNIIYIEDEQQPRATYTRFLKRILGNDFNIIAPEPGATIKDMLTILAEYSDIASYVIDERLTHTGIANYTGTELVEELRNADSKVPVYILTSFADVDPNMGNIEFVIDKNKTSDSQFRMQISARIKRHINIYDDILSDRNNRLNELLKKLVSTELTESERAEYEELNFIRAKPILLEEQGNSAHLKKELDIQEDLLKKIEMQLRDMDS